MEEVMRITVDGYAEDEFTEKKSRFIGQIMPVRDEEEAFAFLEQVRKKHRGARHNCYAWVAGANDEMQRSSDDGEPAGTAGRPILEALKRAELHDAMIVVTRYFGGILLGAGGLTRAYAKAAQCAVEAAGLVSVTMAKRYALNFAYPFIGKVENLLAEFDICVENKIYAEQVSFLCLIEEAQYHPLQKMLSECSGGSLRLQDLGEQVEMHKKL